MVISVLHLLYIIKFKGASSIESKYGGEASPFIKLVSPFRMHSSVRFNLIICTWKSSLVAWLNGKNVAK